MCSGKCQQCWHTDTKQQSTAGNERRTEANKARRMAERQYGAKPAAAKPDQVAMVREGVLTMLQDSGEKDRLKEYLRVKLTECGWRDDMNRWCKEQVEKKTARTALAPNAPPNAEQCTLASCGITDEWVKNEVMPYAMKNIPDYVKEEVLRYIRDFMSSNPSQPESSKKAASKVA